MERIEKAEIKAKEQQEKWDLEIERLKQAKADKEVELLNKRKAEIKLQKQVDHDNYILNRDRQQQIKNEANTPENRTREAFKEAKEKIDRDISRGITRDERAYKNMTAKERRECDNAIAQGDAKDIRAFLKKNRLEKEASEQRRRKLKGL